MSSVDWVVVPSIWWENSPLVIQEAFMHGRPVICSDIGGMAEKVNDGVDGLHFRVERPPSLDPAIRPAIELAGPLAEAARRYLRYLHHRGCRRETSPTCTTGSSEPTRPRGA